MSRLLKFAYVNSMSKLQISIVDGSQWRRTSLTRSLEKAGRHAEPYETFGEYSKRSHSRELLLVHDEPELLRTVSTWCRENHLPVGLLAYSETVDRKAVVRAMRNGAVDYFPWPAAIEELVSELDSCETEIEPWLEQMERSAEARRLIDRLTPRERQVLDCMMLGHSNQEIGKRLGISPRTVEIHRANMLTKLDANNSPDAVRIAFEAGVRSGQSFS